MSAPPPRILVVDPSTVQATSAATPIAAWEADLWHQWRHKQDAGAREQLIKHYLPYAKIIAASSFSRRTHNDIEFEDYLQWASVGLIEATDRYDPKYGAQFKTFASRRMHGAILNGLERITEKNQQIAVYKRLHQERMESAKAIAQAEINAAAGLVSEEASSSTSLASGQTPEELFQYLAEVGMSLALGVLLDGSCMVDTQTLSSHSAAMSPEVSYFRQTELRDLQHLLRELLGRLPPQEQTVIRYHYLQEFCFEDIAAMLGVSRSRISQLHRQGLKTLRNQLPQHASCDVLA